MTQKKTTKFTRPAGKAGTPKKAKSIYRRRAGPMEAGGAYLGKQYGGFLPFNLGESIGKFLGAGVGAITGSGDYTLNGAKPKYNVLSGSVPQFASAEATNIVCHREYIQDFSGTTAFTNAQFPLNPGMAQTFPWLSTVAENYQQYRFHGVVFEFRPATTDYANSGVPGYIIMASNYNADSPTYATKQQMENSEFAESCKPTLKLMHMIECDPKQTINPIKNVRTGAIPTGQDQRLYDLATFQFATQGNSSSVVLGELWITYCVEFFKPIAPTDPGGNIQSGHFRRQYASTVTQPFGTAATAYNAYNGDLLGAAITNNSVSWTGAPGASYMVSMSWYGTNAAVSQPTWTLVGLAAANVIDLNTYNGISAANGVTSNGYNLTYYYTCSLVSAGACSITLNASGVYPTTSNCDVTVTQIDSSVTSLL